MSLVSGRDWLAQASWGLGVPTKSEMRSGENEQRPKSNVTHRLVFSRCVLVHLTGNDNTASQQANRPTGKQARNTSKSKQKQAKTSKSKQKQAKASKSQKSKQKQAKVSKSKQKRANASKCQQKPAKASKSKQKQAKASKSKQMQAKASKSKAKASKSRQKQAKASKRKQKSSSEAGRRANKQTTNQSNNKQTDTSPESAQAGVWSGLTGGKSCLEWFKVGSTPVRSHHDSILGHPGFWDRPWTGPGPAGPWTSPGTRAN